MFGLSYGIFRREIIMVSTPGDTLLYQYETTNGEADVDITDQPQASNFPDLPPVWINAHTLLEMRMILCGIGFVANSLVLLLQLKLKTFKKTQLIFAFTLTATDTIVCPATFMQTYYYRNTTQPVPLIYHAINFGTSVMSYFVIIAVALDRYLALCAFPLKYKVMINLKRYTCVIIVMCAISTGYGCLFSWYFTFEEHPSTTLRTFIVSTGFVGVTIMIYIFVFLSLSKSHDKLSLQTDMKNVRMRQTRRLMFAFGLILSTNIFCNMPQPLFGVYIFFQPIEQGYMLYQNVLISNWLYNLQCLNYTLNPIIYWWQVLFRDISLPCRKRNTGLKKNSSSTIQKVSTVKSEENFSN